MEHAGAIASTPGAEPLPPISSWTGEPEPVARIHRPTRAQFERDFVATGRPVVITGLASEWPAVTRWTRDYLRSTVGECITPVFHYASGNVYDLAAEQTTEMAVARYLDWLDTQLVAPRREQYYLQASLLDHLPALAADAPLPPLFDRTKLTQHIVYIGTNTASANHYHTGFEALLCQIVGRKRVTLFRPEESALVYPYPWYSGALNVSRIDFEAPDLSRFPRLREARPLECVVGAGEILFIPIHWWHLVRSEGYSISVTAFWQASWRSWQLPTPGLRTLPAYVRMVAGRKIEQLRSRKRT